MKFPRLPDWVVYAAIIVAVLFAAPEKAGEPDIPSSWGTRVAVAVVILGALALVAASAERARAAFHYVLRDQ